MKVVGDLLAREHGDDGAPLFRGNHRPGAVAHDGGRYRHVERGGRVVDANPVVRAVDDDADDARQADLARELDELRAVADRPDFRGDDEEDLVRDREHGHRSLVVPGMVVDDCPTRSAAFGRCG